MVILALAFVASALLIYYLAPLSKIRVLVFNTQYEDSATVAILMDGELATLVDLEPREIVTVTYRVAAGTYVFGFSWQYASEAEEFPWLHHTAGLSSAVIPPFEVNVGHFESEMLQWNV